MSVLIKRFIFTALPCEAKPLVAHLKLKKECQSHPFALYANQDTALAVSGCGKVAMAAAVAYSMAYFNAAEQPILLNVGIAGHQTQAVGSLFAAHKICDVDSGRNYYPQLQSPLPCATLAINTVSQPNRLYSGNGLYDMEASGFYEIACRFSCAELIQAFKVVSDNQDCSLDAINEKFVSELIGTQVLAIVEGLDNLETTANYLPSVILDDYQHALERWHFTVNAQLQLKGLLQRWQVLSNHCVLDFDEVALKDSKAVFNWLENKIACLPFAL
jgi:adenosylhomocysteine nucleosidase